MADSSATTSSGAARAAASPDGLLSRLDRLEQRLDALDDLRTTVEAALAAQARRIEAVLARQGRVPAPVDDGHASSELVASLQATVAAVRAGEDDRLDRVEAAIRAVLGPVESMTAAVEALDARVTALLEDHRVTAAAARLDKAEERLAAASDAMDAVADALARRLEPSDPPPSAPEPRPAPTPPVVARPASTPVPARPPSRRTKPMRRAVSDPRDPAAIRRILAGVRGLGPARQSALIDRFGSLDAIRAATDDELLEVPGIGEAMLPGIRDAVR